MKILITGGHLAPALAVIDKLKNDEIIYAGRKAALEGDIALSFEYQVINDLKIRFIEVKTGRFQRKLTKYTFTSIFKIPNGFIKAFKILKEHKPDVVLGFGGYVSLPFIISSYFLNIPSVIHEQTLEVGAANKIASFFASKVCISWESSRKYFPKTKTILTGNPVRKEIIEGKFREIKKNNLIYITGGSLGSHFINSLIAKSLDKILEKHNVMHQTGDAMEYKDYEKLLEQKNKLDKKISKKYEIRKFLNPEESSLALSRADVVISRSGINTVSELIFLNKPSILIPLSFSQKGEQKKNAQMMKNLGIAEILDENRTNPSDLISAIDYMFKNIQKYKVREDIIKTDSAQKIVNVVKNVFNNKKTKEKQAI